FAPAPWPLPPFAAPNFSSATGATEVAPYVSCTLHSLDPPVRRIVESLYNGRPQPMRPALILALALAATSTASTRIQTPPSGLLIRGGTLIDGTGGPRRSSHAQIS